jgi:hypothetical protein
MGISGRLSGHLLSDDAGALIACKEHKGLIGGLQKVMKW